MIVSHKYKFVYLAPPKTGCTSMAFWLIKCFEAENWTTSKNEKWPTHASHVHETMNNYFKFATVRNPYYHEISFWNHWHKKVMKFDEFVEKSVCGKIHRMINLHEGYQPPPECVRFKLDMFIRLEHTEEDIQKLPFCSYYHLPKYEHRNKGNYLNPYVDKHLLEMIKNRRHEDFEMFGYDDTFPPDLLGPRILHQ